MSHFINEHKVLKLRRMLQAIDIEQFVDPGFRKFNNLAMSQLAILASLCLQEGHARLGHHNHVKSSLVDIIQKLEGMANSWSGMELQVQDVFLTDRPISFSFFSSICFCANI